MRQALWPHATATEHQLEMGDILRTLVKNAIIVADVGGGKLVGFVEVSVRDYGEGCATSPVGYVEGWYVDEKYRGQGLGRALIEAAADWARAKSFSELASDAELENAPSIQAHKKIGFQETSRIVTFRRKL
jgi:aminoglycoside 6'-N-acetyltransferase I